MNHSELSHMAGAVDDGTKYRRGYYYYYYICDKGRRAFSPPLSKFLDPPLYSATQKASYCSCACTPRTEPRSRTLACSHSAIRSPSLQFNGLHVITWITTNLPVRSRRDGRLSWLSWLIQSGKFTHKVVTCQPKIGHMSGKVLQPKTDFLITEPRR